MATVSTQICDYLEPAIGKKVTSHIQINEKQALAIKDKMRGIIPGIHKFKNESVSDWVITCGCSNCGFIQEARHSASIRLENLEDVYSKYVCKNCGFIPRRYITGRSDSGRKIMSGNYRFNGVVTFRREKDNKMLKITNSIDSGLSNRVICDFDMYIPHNKEPVTADRNLSNAFVSIWGNNMDKKKASLPDEEESVSSIDSLYDDVDDETADGI